MPRMQSVPFSNMHHIRRPPLCLDSTADTCGLFGRWGPTSGDLMIFTAQHAWVRRSFNMFVGVRDLLDRSAPLSRSSLWRDVTIPPFLQSRAWDMENPTLHPLQCPYMYGGSMPYWRSTKTLHYCDPSSALLNVDGATNSHGPTLCIWLRQRT